MRYDDDPGTTESEDSILDSRGNGNTAQWALAVIPIIIAVISIHSAIAIALTTVVLWWLLRYERFRMLMVSLIGACIIIISLIVFSIIFHPSQMMADVRASLADGSGFGRITGAWSATSQLIPIGVILGVLGGLIAAYTSRCRIRNNPYLVRQEGGKYYHFRYRRTPLQMLRKRSLIRSLKNDTCRPPKRAGEGFGLGIEEEPINPPDDPADIVIDQPIFRMDDEVPTHTVITGQTGSGKTITMQNLIRHDMEKQKTMFILDCKDDPKFAAKIASWCKELDLDFRHFAPGMADEYRIHDNPAGPAFYDPLAHGGVDTKTDMMISTREWDASAEIYKSSAQSLLQTVFSIMGNMNPADPHMANVDTSRGSMYTLYEMVRNPGNLTSAAATVPASSQARALADELVESLRDRRSRDGENAKRAMTEYKSMLRGLMSSAGKYMRLSTDPDRRNIDVFDLASKPGNVVLFSLNATKSTDLGVIIASMICTDLTNMTSSRANSGQTNPVSIYIDEFQSIPPSAVKSMMEKARSAGIGITLAFQSVQQVTAAVGSDAFINALIDTCNNFIFHAGANESTAKIMSEIVGQHTVTDYTMQRRNQQGVFDLNYRNNRNTNVQERSVDKYIVEPRVFQKLASPSRANGFKSETVIIKKASSDPMDSGTTGAVAHRVWMIPPDNVVDDTDYFDPRSPIMEFDDEDISSGFPDSAGESYDEPDEGVTASAMQAQHSLGNAAPSKPHHVQIPASFPSIDDLFEDESAAASGTETDDAMSRVRIGEHRRHPASEHADNPEKRMRVPAQADPAKPAGGNTDRGKPAGRPKRKNRPVSPLQAVKEGNREQDADNVGNASPDHHERDRMRAEQGSPAGSRRIPGNGRGSGQRHRGGLPIV